MPIKMTTTVLPLLMLTLITDAAAQSRRVIAKPHSEAKTVTENGVTTSYFKPRNQRARTCDLTVTLHGFQNSAGKCAVMLVSDEGRYLKVDVRRSRKQWISLAATAADVNIKNCTAKYIVKNVPYGRYSIAAFHDANSNGILDANFVGMPSERYGFTRGARWGLRIPAWNKTAVDLQSPTATAKVVVR